MEAEVGNDEHQLGTFGARSAGEDQPLDKQVKWCGARERQKSPRQTISSGTMRIPSLICNPSHDKCGYGSDEMWPPNTRSGFFTWCQLFWIRVATFSSNLMCAPSGNQRLPFATQQVYHKWLRKGWAERRIGDQLRGSLTCHWVELADMRRRTLEERAKNVRCERADRFTHRWHSFTLCGFRQQPLAQQMPGQPSRWI